MKTQDAVRQLCKDLKKDDGLYITYRANIAMAFKDEFSRQSKNGRVNKTQLHNISNQAADNFLNLLIGDIK